LPSLRLLRESAPTLAEGTARSRIPFTQRYTRSMDSRGRVQVNEACLVPYRLTNSGIQFCLVSTIADNRWEFPKIALPDEADSMAARLKQLAESLGFQGTVRAVEPLGRFEAARGSESRTMAGFLMQVTDVANEGPWQGKYRRLWCLAEEARVRIRRKPLRRFIDLALHSEDVHSSSATVRTG